MTPKVSTIVPAYNASAFIGRAIESIVSQDYPKVETIVVNDGSTDDLEAALHSYKSRGMIRYVRTENKGVSHALNIGIELAKGDYISFLHADDIFLSGKMARQVALMEGEPRCDISYTNESYFLEGGQRVIESPYFHFSGDIFYFLKRSNFIHMSTTMFKKSIFETVRFDEGLACHEDWDLFLKLSARGVKFLYLDEILSSISIHPKNLSSDIALMDMTRHEVGLRAKQLWSIFKKDVNPYSSNGISNLKRYIKFKVYAFAVGFPNRKRYNCLPPKSTFSKASQTNGLIHGSK